MEPNEIKAFRKSRGQSQTAFGQDLQVDRKTVQRWEHGETSPPGNLLERACRDLRHEADIAHIAEFEKLLDCKQLEHAQRGQCQDAQSQE